MKNKTREIDKGRRKFVVSLSLTLAGLAAASVTIPIIGAILAPLLNKSPEDWRVVGLLSDFPMYSTTLVKFDNSDPVSWSGITARSAAWLRRKSEKDFIAFSVNCTHMGCPVRWEKSAELFMCPCHGGVYNSDGTPASGPPQKPLPRYKVRVVNDKVELLTAPIAFTTINNNLKK